MYHSFSAMQAYLFCKDVEGIPWLDVDTDSPIGTSKSEKHDVCWDFRYCGIRIVGGNEVKIELQRSNLPGLLCCVLFYVGGMEESGRAMSLRYHI